jgi:hypothetical protein
MIRRREPTGGHGSAGRVIAMLPPPLPSPAVQICRETRFIWQHILCLSQMI